MCKIIALQNAGETMNKKEPKSRVYWQTLDFLGLSDPPPGDVPSGYGDDSVLRGVRVAGAAIKSKHCSHMQRCKAHTHLGQMIINRFFEKYTQAK